MAHLKAYEAAHVISAGTCCHLTGLQATAVIAVTLRRRWWPEAQAAQFTDIGPLVQQRAAAKSKMETAGL
jgi:hypothetical protein